MAVIEELIDNFRVNIDGSIIGYLVNFCFFFIKLALREVDRIRRPEVALPIL